MTQDPDKEAASTSEGAAVGGWKPPPLPPSSVTSAAWVPPPPRPATPPPAKPKKLPKSPRNRSLWRWVGVTGGLIVLMGGWYTFGVLLPSAELRTYTEAAIQLMQESQSLLAQGLPTRAGRQRVAMADQIAAQDAAVAALEQRALPLSGIAASMAFRRADGEAVRAKQSELAQLFAAFEARLRADLTDFYGQFATGTLARSPELLVQLESYAQDHPSVHRAQRDLASYTALANRMSAIVEKGARLLQTSDTEGARGTIDEWRGVAREWDEFEAQLAVAVHKPWADRQPSNYDQIMDRMARLKRARDEFEYCLLNVSKPRLESAFLDLLDLQATGPTAEDAKERRNQWLKKRADANVVPDGAANTNAGPAPTPRKETAPDAVRNSSVVPPVRDSVLVASMRSEALRRTASNSKRPTKLAADDAYRLEAVRAGQEWLVAHQSYGGAWNYLDLKLTCPLVIGVGNTPVRQTCLPANVENAPWDAFTIGLTGLATLALMADSGWMAGLADDGNGPPQERRRGDAVARALEALLKLQAPSGAFFATEQRFFLYNHVLATLACVQASSDCPTEELKAAAQRGLDYLAAAQYVNDEGRKTGWRYDSYEWIQAQIAPQPNLPNLTAKERAESLRYDASCTAWALRVLQTGVAEGFKVDPESIRAGRYALDGLLGDGDRIGFMGYTQSADAGLVVQGAGTEYTYRFSNLPAMWLSLDGIQRRIGALNPVQLSMYEYLRTDIPSLPRPLNLAKPVLVIDYHAWYYGVLAYNALAQNSPDNKVQREQGKAWKSAAQAALLSLQITDPGSHGFGSWQLSDRWGKYYGGGAIYQTAMAVLTLEGTAK